MLFGRYSHLIYSNVNLVNERDKFALHPNASFRRCLRILQRQRAVASVGAINKGDIAVVAAFDGWPEHLFEVDQVFDDSVSGYSITGPLAGIYGEPGFEMILRVHAKPEEA